MFFQRTSRGRLTPKCEQCGSAGAVMDHEDGPVMWLTCSGCGHRWWLTPEEMRSQMIPVDNGEPP